MALIIVGYQGIGKSTVAKNVDGFIDFESSCFFVDGKRSEDWYIAYCQCAINIADQGYTVFVSSHKAVRDYLSSLPLPKDVSIVTISPDISLKDDWILKLDTRYKATGLDKDFKAFANANVSYDSNVKDIQESSGFTHVIITNIKYDLQDIISTLEKVLFIPGVTGFRGTYDEYYII